MILRSIKRPRTNNGASKLAMTPMIDIVFQLLIFFILTFKVVPQEGDLYVAAAEDKGKTTPEQVEDAPLPMKLTLESNDKGELAGIQLNKKRFETLEKLQKHLITYFGDERGPDSLQAKTTLEITPDERLKHKHLIKAIDAVSGYKVDGKLIRLVAKMKFSNP